MGIKLFGGFALKSYELATFGRLKIGGFGNLQSENDVIVTAWLRGRGALGVKLLCQYSRLRWSLSLRRRAVLEVPRLQKPLGCDAINATKSGTQDGTPPSTI